LCAFEAGALLLVLVLLVCSAVPGMGSVQFARTAASCISMLYRDLHMLL
jgi:hypothetical protein